jgi:hypothetical protein
MIKLMSTEISFLLLTKNEGSLKLSADGKKAQQFQVPDWFVHSNHRHRFGENNQVGGGKEFPHPQPVHEGSGGGRPGEMGNVERPEGAPGKGGRMNMRCPIKTNSGLCGRPATVLDPRLDFFVCGGHSAFAVNVADFRRRIELAVNEWEVRRTILQCQEFLTGSWQEINEALNFAIARELHFSGGAEGVPAMEVAA